MGSSRTADAGLPLLGAGLQQIFQAQAPPLLATQAERLHAGLSGSQVGVRIDRLVEAYLADVGVELQWHDATLYSAGRR
jgi:hypothetical protein